MLAEGMEGQILFMSLKCTQTKRLPQSPCSTPRARSEMKRKLNLKILVCSSFLLRRIKAIYKLILLAHKVLLSSGAWRDREKKGTLLWKPSVLILLPFSCCVVIDWVICGSLSMPKARWRLTGEASLSQSLSASLAPCLLFSRLLSWSVKIIQFFNFPPRSRFTRNHSPPSACVHPSCTRSLPLRVCEAVDTV